MASNDLPNTHVRIRYVNYQGQESVRVIQPGYIHFGSNEWHVDLQWILEAWDVEKKDWRSFALSGISGWAPEDAKVDPGRERGPDRDPGTCGNSPS